jgi:alpha-galactosidase
VFCCFAFHHSHASLFLLRGFIFCAFFQVFLKNMFVLLVAFVAMVVGLENGLARTPPMGFNTWDSFRCNYNEKDVTTTIDAISQLKLTSFGWTYFNLDDCWATSRASNWVIQADPVKFPRGISYLANYAHAHGLLFGIYTDRGNETCAGRPGTRHYEKIDALTYAS